MVLENAMRTEDKYILEHIQYKPNVDPTINHFGLTRRQASYVRSDWHQS